MATAFRIKHAIKLGRSLSRLTLNKNVQEKFVQAQCQRLPVIYNHVRHWSSQPETQTTDYHNIIKDTEKATGESAKHEFQSETQMLLQIVANCKLYSDKEVFVRELVSIYKDKVPVLLQIMREMCNIGKIQKLCDTLTEHPTWTLAHLAAYFALRDAFMHPIVNSQLNSGDSETGISPLQVAVQTNNLRTVEMLIAAKSSLEHLDHNANTVYHYAATSTKEIILALGSGFPNSLNSRNSNGHTPMHVACLNDKPECVKALLLIGADVNISASEGHPSSPGYVGDFLHNKQNVLQEKDMKFGGTPLHWSRSHEVITALIDAKCNIDALNFDGRTALHVMVRRKSLPCVMALLTRMASVNIVDNDGNTPLHLAVEAETSIIVDALYCFNANINARNCKAETPMHKANIDTTEGKEMIFLLHDIGAQRCPPEMEGCHLGCKHGGNYTGIAPSEPPQPPQYVLRTIRDQMNRVFNDWVLYYIKGLRTIEKY